MCYLVRGVPRCDDPFPCRVCDTHWADLLERILGPDLDFPIEEARRRFKGPIVDISAGDAAYLVAGATPPGWGRCRMPKHQADHGEFTVRCGHCNQQTRGAPCEWCGYCGACAGAVGHVGAEKIQEVLLA